jgi:hypothetical protein
MTMNMTAAGNLAAHYQQVRARLGMSPSPRTNRLKTVLAEANKRQDAGRKAVASAPQFLDYLDGCPFTATTQPALRAAVNVILVRHHVTWKQVVGQTRPYHLVCARIVIAVMLNELGYSPARIGYWLNRDRTTIYALLNNHAEKVWGSQCFSDAMTCVRDINQGLSAAQETTPDH